MTQEELFELVFAIDGNLKQSISKLQDGKLFNYRLHKLRRLQNIARQRPFENGWRMLAQVSWEPILSEVDWGEFEYFDYEFFEDLGGDKLQEKLAFMDKTIVFVTSYPPQAGPRESKLQTLRQFSNFYLASPNTLFLGWDWDNHFNLHISSVLAASSDVYFPSHLSNDYELSNFCSNKYRMPLSGYQWSRGFLNANLDLVMRTDRRSEVFGRFMNYGIFRHRNELVTTLAQQIPTITLADDLGGYHTLDLRGKLEEWTRYKCHWVVPTLTDVSTRVFDVLITGGIVIVPERFRGDPVFADIDERDCLYYNEQDVLDAQPLVNRALASFDRDGIDGVLRRHRYALDRHNLDSRVKSMLDTARDLLPKLFP